MSKIAVIKTGGKQYIVHADDKLKVEKLESAVGDLSFTTLLTAEDDGSVVEIGKPTLTGDVKGKFVAQGRAKKVLVVHYKAKVRYHKKYGHRQPFTQVAIDKII